MDDAPGPTTVLPPTARSRFDAGTDL